MTFQCIFIFKGCPYTGNNNTGREKTWHQSPVPILTLMNKTMPMFAPVAVYNYAYMTHSSSTHSDIEIINSEEQY